MHVQTYWVFTLFLA